VYLNTLQHTNSREIPLSRLLFQRDTCIKILKAPVQSFKSTVIPTSTSRLPKVQPFLKGIYVKTSQSTVFSRHILSSKLREVLPFHIVTSSKTSQSKPFYRDISFKTAQSTTLPERYVLQDLANYNLYKEITTLKLGKLQPIQRDNSNQDKTST
jgi:hypothetical protein